MLVHLEDAVFVLEPVIADDLNLTKIDHQHVPFSESFAGIDLCKEFLVIQGSEERICSIVYAPLIAVLEHNGFEEEYLSAHHVRNDFARFFEDGECAEFIVLDCEFDLGASNDTEAVIPSRSNGDRVFCKLTRTVLLR
ncbi:hypothetical protein WL80_29055 [Burkholderia ubonensis]|uniref:hypothetical protein n=1 Tax=Burkholderia ubonensis TaxID=101571 RepID=UPI00075CCC5D|nr:hypothetical protein [Burkholderia ubonensis]KWF01712.1 hypothetical protein WL80_29055 [Burkholderia ubonensis]